MSRWPVMGAFAATVAILSCACGSPSKVPTSSASASITSGASSTASACLSRTIGARPSPMTGGAVAFAMPSSTPILGAALGADGNVWFTEDALDRVLRVQPNGATTEFCIPGDYPNPRDLVAALTATYG